MFLRCAHHLPGFTVLGTPGAVPRGPLISTVKGQLCPSDVLGRSERCLWPDFSLLKICLFILDREHVSGKGGWAGGS